MRSVFRDETRRAARSSEQALYRGVVPDVARAAHRTGDAVLGEQLLEVLAGVLAALVGVMQ